MRAALGIDAILGQPQPFHRPSAHQVFLHNLFGVRRLHISVPDGLGINHHRWPVFALIQAAGFINADLAAKSGSLRKLLQLRKQLAFPIGSAGRAWCIGGAGVVANKNMAIKDWQAVFLLKGAG